jgi:purine nucleosidase
MVKCPDASFRRMWYTRFHMDALTDAPDFAVPDAKKIRLIIDTDAKNEADDQFAIVHTLLTQKFLVRGIVAAQFGTRRTAESVSESYGEIRRVLELMGRADVRVERGYETAIPPDVRGVTCAGSELIVEEAMRDDGHRLFCIFLGPLTDMALALRARPEIAGRVTVIWIGGGVWPDGGWEFNLSNDIEAANVVYESGVELWQVPRNVYSRLRVSLSELRSKVAPCGAIGNYLARQLFEFNETMGGNPGWPLGESWVLGDSAAIGLLLDDQEFDCDHVSAPRVRPDMTYELAPAGAGDGLGAGGGHGAGPVNRAIRMYRTVDSRFILEDFFCKLASEFR